MKKHLWYIDAIIETPVRITVSAVDEQEAFARVNDGAWHACQQMPGTWDKAKVKSVGTFTKGPGLN